MPIEMSIREYVNRWQSKGRYWFTDDEALDALGVSAAALRQSLWRLERKHRVARIRNGFYVIVPMEYSARGILPPEWFIDDFMSHLDSPYYVGLLSAAEIHGAAHQKPQELQVIVEKDIREIRSNDLLITFFRNSALQGTHTQKVKTSTGYLRVSDPAATALDLVTYSRRVGGLDRVATVVAELKERIVVAELIAAAENAKALTSVQRLGWLLDRLGARKIAASLQMTIRRQNASYTRLDPDAPKRGFPYDARWKVIVNTEIEPEA